MYDHPPLRRRHTRARARAHDSVLIILWWWEGPLAGADPLDGLMAPLFEIDASGDDDNPPVALTTFSSSFLSLILLLTEPGRYCCAGHDSTLGAHSCGTNQENHPPSRLLCQPLLDQTNMFGMPFMGMPMPGMGVPMGMAMPLGMPIPGVTPGMPGTGWYNSLPGRFGRDMLGRGGSVTPDGSTRSDQRD